MSLLHRLSRSRPVLELAPRPNPTSTSRLTSRYHIQLSALHSNSTAHKEEARGLGAPSTLRGQFLKGLKKDYGADYAELTVPTKELLDALRDMQSWRQLTPSTAKSADFRDSLRCISLLAGPDGGATKPTLKVKDIEAVLSDENGVTWRLIRHLIEHGLVPELEALDDKWKAMVRFNRVHGFGKSKVQDYVDAGARTLDDLLNAKDKEWGRKVSDAQKLAIRYHQEMDLMIPRSEVAEFEGLIRDALNKVDPTLGFAIMGSYRRGEYVSSDIDMVVWHESFQRRDKDEKRSKTGWAPDSLMGKVMSALFGAGLLEEGKLFSGGAKKVLALTKLPRSASVHRQIDIRLCPLESLPYMLLGNTGDDMLMRILRARAMTKGWVLNEYAMGERLNEEYSGLPSYLRPALSHSALIKEGTEIIVKSEQEIFAKLGLPYLEPEQRSYHKYRNIVHS